MPKVFPFLMRKLVRMLLLLLCASMLTFLLVSLSPVDPLQVNVGQAALGQLSPEQVERLRAFWGVDEPLLDRFLAWGSGFLRGDMGISLRYRQPVATIIWEKLSNSIVLLALSWVVSGLLGFALGVISGACEGRWPDKLIRGYSLLIASTPTFWLAILLLLVFAVWVPVLPIGLSVPIGMEASAVTFADTLRHAILPALALSITGTASITLHTRRKMMDAMHSDYALFAAARGDSKARIALRHGVRNVLLPAITLQFASIGEIIGGSVLVEQVFSYPGLGQAAVTAGLGGDVPLLLGVTVTCAAIVFLGNFAADILYGVIDPRMRRRKAS